MRSRVSATLACALRKRVRGRRLWASDDARFFLVMPAPGRGIEMLLRRRIRSHGRAAADHGAFRVSAGKGALTSSFYRMVHERLELGKLIADGGSGLMSTAIRPPRGSSANQNVT
jgi:hypothetical protein